MDEGVIKKMFPDFEDALIHEIIKQGRHKLLNAGAALLQTGQPIRYVVLIINGIVKVYREDKEGKEFFIYHLSAGQACSLSMIPGNRQENSDVLAIAATEVRIMIIPLSCMEQWMTKYKTWQRFVIITYRQRCQELLRHIDAIAFKSVDDRLVFYLQGLAARLGSYMKITHKGIANDLNSSREVISRSLKKMQAKGWLIIHRNAIEWLKKD